MKSMKRRHKPKINTCPSGQGGQVSGTRFIGEGAYNRDLCVYSNIIPIGNL